NSTGGTCTALTPRVCCAVSAAIADSPCTRCAAKVLRSAWIPAPPPESEPAMVRALGGRRVMAGCARERVATVQRQWKQAYHTRILMFKTYVSRLYPGGCA